MKALEDRVRALPCWQGPVTLEPLKGGLTNISFVVTDGGRKFVARCGEDIPVHHVFRDRERAASIAAYKAGLSPEIVYSEPGILVLRFVQGRTYEEADLRADPAKIAGVLRACHAEVAAHLQGPPNFFWVFHVIRDYARLLDDGAKHVALADRLEALQMPMPIVFGHHDLLPGNFIDDGKKLWLIDWEYGGFGTAMFDLANVASNGAYGEAEDAALLAAYFGTVTDETRRSFDAMKAASALREGLWALVSDRHLRTPGIDYQAHAREYLSRAAAADRLVKERYGT